ncbi:MAG: flagellar biosynthetic protein FliO [Betaproteobacteria bacterium]|nr:flagellar biosynthetic protein FliO [Betaproteobacteria bacterium]
MDAADAIESIVPSFTPSRKSATIKPAHCADVTRPPRESPRWLRLSISLFLTGYGALPVNTSAAALAGNGGNGGSGGSLSDASMLQVMLGLGIVLALMAGLAWLLKRFAGTQRGASGVIRVIGGSAVGQRERVVLVEVADTWLVIGVAPGQVSALHSMPKRDANLSTSGLARNDDRFSAWLRQVMEKRHGEGHGEQQRAE